MTLLIIDFSHLKYPQMFFQVLILMCENSTFKLLICWYIHGHFMYKLTKMYASLTI